MPNGKARHTRTLPTEYQAFDHTQTQSKRASTAANTQQVEQNSQTSNFMYTCATRTQDRSPATPRNKHQQPPTTQAQDIFKKHAPQAVPNQTQREEHIPCIHKNPRSNITPDQGGHRPQRPCAQGRTGAEQEQARAVAPGLKQNCTAGGATTSGWRTNTKAKARNVRRGSRLESMCPPQMIHHAGTPRQEPNTSQCRIHVSVARDSHFGYTSGVVG